MIAQFPALLALFPEIKLENQLGNFLQATALLRFSIPGSFKGLLEESRQHA